MQNILTLMMLTVLLFPSFASSEEVTWDDLVRREGLYCKKFTDIPFTGKITGQTRGHLKDGVEDGPWVSYHENGQLIDSESGTFRNGVNID